MPPSQTPGVVVEDRNGGAPTLEDGTNPLASFRADAFHEARRMLEAEKRGALVRQQARIIRDRLLDADLSLGFVALGKVWGMPYLENVKHLRENGFRVFEINEVRDDHCGPPVSFLSYHLTWDSSADSSFRPHFDSYMKSYATGGSDQSSFREVLLGR